MVGEIAVTISKIILETAASCIPNKLVTIRKNDQPWFTGHLRQLIRKRKRLHTKAKHQNTNESWAAYRKHRNLTINEVRKAKQLYYENLADKIDHNTLNIKDWWKTSKLLLNSSTSSSIPPLIHNDNFIENDKDKANFFNKYFKDQSKLDDRNLNPIDINNENTYPPLSSIRIQEIDVKDVLLSLDPSKSSGPDEISPRVLKEGASELSKPLCKLFNLSLTKQKFPRPWKDANVTPIHKKDSKNVVNNYRPISLLSCIGKVMERCVFKQMYNYFITNSVISPLQSGFKSGDSTVNQLLKLYDSFCSALDESKEVRVIFFDISKAFDKVWHKGLIQKLKRVGIRDELLKWVTSYLSERRQKVVINNQQSEYLKVEAGVPQGSILGPLFFLIYINDLVNEINSNLQLFADDTSMYLVVGCPVNVATYLNADLEKIVLWAKQWLVTFNPNKTVSMIISRKQNKPIHPILIMDNTQLTQVEHHKHLGLYFSSDGGWHKHIQHIAEKAWKRVNILRSLKFLLKKKSLEKLYFSFIRPILEYGDVVWDNCSLDDKRLLENIQIESARIVTGSTKFVSIEKLYLELGWETLQKRRTDHKLIMFYKMTHSIAPRYLQDLVPPTTGNRSNYSYQLRNTADPSYVNARTTLYKNSFLPSTVIAWNNLPPATKTSTSLSCFKHLICQPRYQRPAYFNTGPRRSQILHTRIRLECSLLKAHLFKANLIDSPLCECGESETSTHFLLNCSRFDQQRRQFISPLGNSVDTKTLLSGNTDLDEEENKIIFSSVQSYITATKRFDTQL